MTAKRDGADRILIVPCNARDVRNKRCGASALFESDNCAEKHAYYRCQRPECNALVVTCFNEEHTQGRLNASDIDLRPS